MNNTLTIEGIQYTPDELAARCRIILADHNQPEWLKQIYGFIAEWLNEEDTLEVKTSGTTGKPKKIRVSKEAMIKSAQKTLAFFELKRGDTALLCLPGRYIAGKMMIVRAIAGGLNLILREPSIDIWSTLDEEIDFIPVIPLQLQSLIKHPQKQQLITKILVGGAPIDPTLENHLREIKPEIYQSYGMTETLTHIAVRNVKADRESMVYKALHGVSFSVSEENRLVAYVDFLKNPVYTNDVVELINQHEFIWKGRADMIINSGGIKIHPEEVEKKLESIIPGRFLITGQPDEKLGQKVVLIIEGESCSREELRELQDKMQKILNKYELPRAVHFISSFPVTQTGKIQRKKVL